MLATLIFEFSAAIYTFVRYKMDKISRLITAILITLGLFQLSEYMICGGLGLTSASWMKFGYIATAMLPIYGLHLIITIAEKKKPIILSIAYASAAIFIIYYIFDSSAISGQQCFANYAVFYSQGIMSQLFSIYYLVWILACYIHAKAFSRQLPEKRKPLRAIIIGGAVFLGPTYLFNLIDPTTVRAIPSIMCGFAIFFAMALVFFVLPISGKKR